MKIELYFYASLARYMPDASGERSCVMEIKQGITVGELLDDLNVPDDAIKLIFLNGLHAKGDEILKDGDRVGVFPPVAGG